MYSYNPIDQSIVDARVDEFRDQVRRYRAGEIEENEFLQLRLRNGLYLQRHAYMLRVAVPYGTLSSDQLRRLGHIARTYDKGYAHFTTRQNIQFNWPELDDVPDILAELAAVQMHAIQTSGNCVRNTTADHLAGVAGDELEDPRPWCEMIRQWSTLNPEFNWLPRKFKIAVTGAREDRAAIAYHDIGLKLVRHSETQETGFEVWVGGGLGRTPVIGKVVRRWLEPADLLSYIDAILRVYNTEGDRKKKFRARIKILVRRLGVDVFAERVEAEFSKIKEGPLKITAEQLARFKAHFPAPAYAEGLGEKSGERLDERLDEGLDARQSPLPKGADPVHYQRWLTHNVGAHKVPGYAVVTVSLKSEDRAPGDITAEQLGALADLADTFSFGEIRSTHLQNLILPDVETGRLGELYQALLAHDLATPNIGLLTDQIACPGLDFCNLGSASSLSVAADLSQRFAGQEKLYQIGAVSVKMSGCVNACGHHHAGHIGILGVDKKGEQAFQIMLGGDAGNAPSLGRWLGPALAPDEVAEAVETLGDVYLKERQAEETFLDTVRRLGVQPFHDGVYGRGDSA